MVFPDAAHKNGWHLAADYIQRYSRRLKLKRADKSTSFTKYFIIQFDMYTDETLVRLFLMEMIWLKYRVGIVLVLDPITIHKFGTSWELGRKIHICRRHFDH